MTTKHLSWGTIETRFATFAAWVDEDGRLVRFNLDARGAAGVDRDAHHDERAIAGVRRQVEEYCAGERTVFALELAARGTAFQHAVWDALVQIPYGETCSYGEIAKAIGQPQAARGVGAANGANPIALIVPCHRVIGADGSLTGYGGGLPLKRMLLAHEASIGRRRRGRRPGACSRERGYLPMRLWTLHPRYLDAQGLVALWRESLLARAVLRGRTRGYRHHPQLARFLAHPSPRYAINAYLAAIHVEATTRGYAFDASKVGHVRAIPPIPTTTGQVLYEWQHLLKKLAVRDRKWRDRWRTLRVPRCHPLFARINGPAEPWERVGSRRSGA